MLSECTIVVPAVLHVYGNGRVRVGGELAQRRGGDTKQPHGCCFILNVYAKDVLRSLFVHFVQQNGVLYKLKVSARGAMQQVLGWIKRK
jgi:hypothetical protein